MTKPKRGYSRDYTPEPGTTPGAYLLRQIPEPLWNAAKEKAQRDGVSIRQVLLDALSAWINRPDVSRTAVARRLEEFRNASDMTLGELLQRATPSRRRK